MSESVLVSHWEQVDVDDGNQESLHNFCIEIGRYKLFREESLTGFGTGVRIIYFNVAGIRHYVTESYNNALRYSNSPWVRGALD